MIGYSHKHNRVAHFRVDCLAGFEVSTTGVAQLENFDVAPYTNIMIDMFASEGTLDVELLCDNELMRVIDVYKRQVFGSQKGAIAILEKSGTPFEASNLYQERYLAELDAFCKEQERVQREKQKEFKASHPELFGRYPKFSKALAKVLDTSDAVSYTHLDVYKRQGRSGG